VSVILVRILRVLLVLFILRLVLRLWADWRRAKSDSASGNPRGGPAGGATRANVELVRDRICNTFLPRERALTARVAGRQEHFCSARCRDQALAAAARAS
jgi:hypothetical protein